MQTKILSLKEIKCDPTLQSRAQIDPVAVEEYALAMKQKARFPPVDVFKEHGGTEYLLAHGFHRVKGAERAGLDKIKANVHIGDRHQAALFSASANADLEKVGLRRTNADKRRAVEMLLADPVWNKRTAVWIARAAKVDPGWVRKVRREMDGRVNPPPSEVVGVDGKLHPRGYPRKPKRSATKAGEAGSNGTGKTELKPIRTKRAGMSTMNEEREASIKLLAASIAECQQEFSRWAELLENTLADIRVHSEMYGSINVRDQIPGLIKLFSHVQRIRGLYIEAPQMEST